mgnify:CR=1 FL=1
MRVTNDSFDAFICRGVKTKKRTNLLDSLCLVAEARLERTTFGLWAQRATNCSTPRCLWVQRYCFYFKKQIIYVIIVLIEDNDCFCNFLYFPIFYSFSINCLFSDCYFLINIHHRLISILVCMTLYCEYPGYNLD